MGDGRHVRRRFPRGRYGREMMLAMVWVQGRTVAVYVCATWMLLVREQRGRVCERSRDSGRERDGGRERGRESPVAVQLAVECVQHSSAACDALRQWPPTFRLGVLDTTRLLSNVRSHGTHQTRQHNSSRLSQVAMALQLRRALRWWRGGPVVVANSSCGGEKGWVTAGEQQSLSALTRAGGEAC